MMDHENIMKPSVTSKIASSAGEIAEIEKAFNNYPIFPPNVSKIMQEPKITINNVTLTDAQAMAVRVAIADMEYECTGSPSDRHHMYRDLLREVLTIIMRQDAS
jgi:hypothetical protein